MRFVQFVFVILLASCGNQVKAYRIIHIAFQYDVVFPSATESIEVPTEKVIATDFDFVDDTESEKYSWKYWGLSEKDVMEAIERRSREEHQKIADKMIEATKNNPADNVADFKTDNGEEPFVDNYENNVSNNDGTEAYYGVDDSKEHTMEAKMEALPMETNSINTEAQPGLEPKEDFYDFIETKIDSDYLDYLENRAFY